VRAWAEVRYRHAEEARRAVADKLPMVPAVAVDAQRVGRLVEPDARAVLRSQQQRALAVAVPEADGAASCACDNRVAVRAYRA